MFSFKRFSSSTTPVDERVTPKKKNLQNPLRYYYWMGEHRKEEDTKEKEEEEEESKEPEGVLMWRRALS